MSRIAREGERFNQFYTVKGRSPMQSFYTAFEKPVAKKEKTIFIPGPLFYFNKKNHKNETYRNR